MTNKELKPDIKFGDALIYSEDWLARNPGERRPNSKFIATGRITEQPKGWYIIHVVREGTSYVLHYHESFLALIDKPPTGLSKEQIIEDYLLEQEAKPPAPVLNRDLYWKIMAILHGIQLNQKELPWKTTLDSVIEELKELDADHKYYQGEGE